MSAAHGLLTAAEAMLASDRSHGSRMCCWLTRTALEAVVADLLADRGLDTARANMRSRLACLDAAYEDAPDVRSRVHYAWARLSDACHHHAYQLSPTYGEARHLLDLVASIVTEGPVRERT